MITNQLDGMNISGEVFELVSEAEAGLAAAFSRIEETELVNQARVLAAFQNERIGQRHFAPTTGYGYDDIGRDALDRVFAHALCCEDALVRPTFANGTHTIFTALSGLLEPGDTLLFAAGAPYDTLKTAIGINGDAFGSLARNGVKYKQVELKNDDIDLDGLLAALDKTVKVVCFQRSRGYAWRDSLPLSRFEAVFKAVHDRAPHAALVVDNCYGEFTGKREPSALGADIIVGSLIKNPGGGLAPTGGYVAGRAELVERIANRVTVPGMGREVGSYVGGYQPFYQGLFMAPHITAQSLKTAALFAAVFERLGMTTMPNSNAERSDIVQAVRFRTPEALIAFCQSIQTASPIDSDAVPMPWDMPGYTDQVIMAAGAFVQGASIELSADAPIRPPYAVYIQGGLTYSHGKLGVAKALEALKRAGEIRI